jgi:DNA polymerase-3 subunit delta
MLIFLYGEDQFRSQQKLKEIKNKYLKSDKTGSGLSVFDCDEKKIEGKEIISIINTPNLLAPKRLIIIKRMIASFSTPEQKELLDFLKINIKKIKASQDSIVIFWEANQPKRNNALYKFLNKTKKQNFEKLEGYKLTQWVLKMLALISPDTHITKKALEKLIIYCAGDSASLFSELEKLINYSQNNLIEEKEVEILVKAHLNSNIFQVIDALGNRNKKEALTLLHEHLISGEDPYYLMSMFIYQFRNLIRIADYKERGVISEYEIAKSAKLHPFVVKKSLAQLNHFSLNQLKVIYTELSKIDEKIKQGKTTIQLALDKFIAEL